MSASVRLRPLFLFLPCSSTRCDGVEHLPERRADTSSTRRSSPRPHPPRLALASRLPRPARLLQMGRAHQVVEQGCGALRPRRRRRRRSVDEGRRAGPCAESARAGRGSGVARRRACMRLIFFSLSASGELPFEPERPSRGRRSGASSTSASRLALPRRSRVSPRRSAQLGTKGCCCAPRSTLARSRPPFGLPVVRTQLVEPHLLAAKDVERRAVREVDLAVREALDEGEVVDTCAARGRKRGRAREEEEGGRGASGLELRVRRTRGGKDALRAPPAYVVGIETHSPSSAREEEVESGSCRREEERQHEESGTHSQRAPRRCLGTGPRRLRRG